MIPTKFWEQAQEIRLVHQTVSHWEVCEGWAHNCKYLHMCAHVYIRACMVIVPPERSYDTPSNCILENVEHCGGEPEQADTGYYVTNE